MGHDRVNVSLKRKRGDTEDRDRGFKVTDIVTCQFISMCHLHYWNQEDTR